MQQFEKECQAHLCIAMVFLIDIIIVCFYCKQSSRLLHLYEQIFGILLYWHAILNGGEFSQKTQCNQNFWCWTNNTYIHNQTKKRLERKSGWVETIHFMYFWLLKPQRHIEIMSSTDFVHHVVNYTDLLIGNFQLN